MLFTDFNERNLTLALLSSADLGFQQPHFSFFARRRFLSASASLSFKREESRGGGREEETWEKETIEPIKTIFPIPMDRWERASNANADKDIPVL